MRKFAGSVYNPSHKKRFLFFFFMDILIITASLYSAFLLRFAYQLRSEFLIGRHYMIMITQAFPIFLAVKLSVLGLFRIYRITWRYVGVHDLVNIARAVAVSQFILILVILFLFNIKLFDMLNFDAFIGFPRSIFIIDGLISFLLLAGLRISKRIFLEVLGKGPCKKGLTTVIVGAGNIGETVVRDMIRQRFADYYPVAFLDDDSEKIGSYIHGVQVTGNIGSLKETVKKLKAEAVIIAIPSLNYEKLRCIYSLAKQSNVRTVKIIPSMHLRQRSEINIKEFKDISIEDIIGRQNVTVDFEQIEKFLKGKTVLVTGAGGSIGSEIVMQVCSFKPRKIILLDADETELHNMEMKIKRNHASIFEDSGGLDDKDIYGRVFFVVGDIRDKERMESVFRQFRPHVVFHSAAYKHVPMMESNPGEAVKVNIFGTYNLAKVSTDCGVEKFVMISTDKAVRPTSIMGSTKKIAEYICSAFDNAGYGKADKSKDSGSAGTAFISVRFGNVLGSRGSILPLFLEQLKEGGPITVTHKDMKRYFMTIPEAVALVLQASVLGKGGEVMVLDMGEPVSIVRLAEELIILHGLKPYEDIKIEFTGIRPGENLFEEILTRDEVATRHEKIFIAENINKCSLVEVESIIGKFCDALKGNGQDKAGIKELLDKYS